MTEQLSEGAQMWYEEYQKCRDKRERDYRLVPALKPQNDYQETWTEFNIVDEASGNALKRNAFKPQEASAIFGALIDGFFRIRSIYFNIPGKKAQEMVDEHLPQIYEPLYDFLHPLPKKENT